MAVALKQLFNNKGGKQHQTKHVSLLFDPTARNINYELQTTGQEAGKKKKLQDKSNPAPELIACRSLARSARSLVYIGSWK